jgi:hypothetical protein
MMASKTGSGVALERAAGIKNVFINDWKGSFDSDPKKKIASISFMRNLIEYTRGDADPDLVKLTSLLHWKADSQEITVSDLDDIYERLFSKKPNSPDGNTPVVELITDAATECLKAPDGINFANKVVLAIATRLVAEQFMVTKINDAAFTERIGSNQTAQLLKKYQELYPAENSSLKVLQRVVLMTPENIHLNSFMYEPILDMSDTHLRKLYTDAKALQNGDGGQA